MQTNGLTTLTKNKINTGAIWSRTLASKAVQTTDLSFWVNLGQPATTGTSIIKEPKNNTSIIRKYTINGCSRVRLVPTIA